MTQGDAVAIHPLLILVHLKKENLLAMYVNFLCCFFFSNPQVHSAS